MLVSWNWLKDYVNLEMEPDELAHRFSMTGLNHEGTTPIGDDLVIDLEVTSNRPDCLGHIGVAREVAVLWETELRTPQADPAQGGTPVADLTSVRIDCPDLCSRYTARVIQGMKIGPSPSWLADRLASIGLATINNVVDVTNFVLMETGQPLHAFDFAKLRGRQIIVRDARAGEEFEAIDHRSYTLEQGMCVIADAENAVALGGVMGGAETEVSEATTELFIESAEFAPVSIRNTARKLNLHSPSSFRFERGIDPEGVDWASRRCCKMILELCGGELAEGVIDVGSDAVQRGPVVLRLSQLPRVLGIDVSAEEVARILKALGCIEHQVAAGSVEVIPPSWRRDLTREIDLVEEVARIHGYEKIPEDVAVPMAPSHRTDEDRVLEKVRDVLISAGLDEAMTTSVVTDEWTDAFSPWSRAEPIISNIPLLRGADRLRRSLVPSLLEARRINESLANPVIELFETARVYLPSNDGLVTEPLLLGITSGGDFFRVKGIVEALVAALNPAARVDVADGNDPFLDQKESCELRVDGRLLGYVGKVSDAALKRFGLRSTTTIAELDMRTLQSVAQLIPQHQPLSQFPPIARDLNFIVDESLRWASLAATVREAAGDCLEQLDYRETFRDANRDGPGKKRLLLTATLRSTDRTMTNEEADAIRDQVVAACQQKHGATLVG